MQNDALKLLLEEAKELEKKYEWLQAAESYEKAADSALEDKNFLKAAELQERLGFCLYKAADQAQTNIKFRKLMKQAANAYKKEPKVLEEANVKDKQVRIDHANARIAYVEAVLEKSSLKKKKLLDEWWTLENQVIMNHEKNSDLSSAGKVCNELLEYSRSNRFWLVSNHLEWTKNQGEYLSLAEKAIKIFSKLNDNYELARAYFLAAYYYSFSPAFGQLEDKIEPFKQKVQEYSNKALELSHKTGDPYLIGESLRSKYWGAQRDGLRDPTLAMEGYEKAIKYGEIAKNNNVFIGGNLLAANLLSAQALVLEDPDEQKENLKKAIKLIQKAKHFAEIAENILYSWVAYRDLIHSLNLLASIETDYKTKQELLETATVETEEGMKRLRDWKMLSIVLLSSMSHTLQLTSKIKSEIEETRKLLQKSKHYIKKYIILQKEMHPLQYAGAAISYFQLAQVQDDLATIETDDNLKIKLLTRAVKSVKESIEIWKKHGSRDSGKLTMKFVGMFYDFLGSLLVQINLVSKQENALVKAIDSYQKASLCFEKAEMPTHLAESYWHMAQFEDELGECQKASKDYELAAQAYDLSSKKISQLSEFYTNHSKYMLAWSQIEQAKYSHSIEEYDRAQQNYETAAKLHEKIGSWNYLAPNYLAWAEMEKAESQSRKENTRQAKQTFQKALEQFTVAEKTIKEKIEEITSPDEKEMTQKLFQASNLRRRYCKARILVEDAKLLDREGKYRQSSKSYAEAAENISTIIDVVDVEAERKELEYLAVLCRAWEKMATAEEKASSEAYLEAAEIFERARDYCFTRKASLWALGNSNFCRGLAAGVQYQIRLELAEHVRAKRYMKNASTNYQQAGFKNAAEYAKATQRLFDAYVFMNQAESEVNPEKRARQYQMAENVLQIAAGSFMKAKQPEKTTQVKGILSTVKEEKVLAASLNEVMHAPTITSSTISFTAPTPTSEASVGLESFEHANVQANLVVGLKEVRVGESFCLSVEFVNAGKEPALLTRVDDFVPPGFVVAKKPEIYRLEESCLNMKGKQIAPLKLVEAKLVLQPSKKGVYNVKPRVHYLDELGQNKVLQLKSVEIKVEEVKLADRVSTGTKELDSLLLGGIPEEYAVVLTGSPSDERELLIKNFLEAGIEKGGISFYVTTEADGLGSLLEKSDFYLFLCNLRPKVDVPDLPNVYKLHGKTDLNNLGIALVKAYRRLSQKPGLSRRVCVQILSDVLVNYGSKTARKWISELITDLGSKGFTLLAVLDSSMHPVDQANAVLNLFDGEISLTQREDTLEGKSVVVRKLRNQDYIKNPICLTIPVQQ